MLKWKREENVKGKFSYYAKSEMYPEGKYTICKVEFWLLNYKDRDNDDDIYSYIKLKSAKKVAELIENG